MGQKLHPIARWLLSAAVVAGALWLVLLVFGANQKSYLYASIGSGGHSVMVGSSGSLGKKYAYLMVEADSNRSIVIVEANEWDQILQMFGDARTHQSQTWRVVGTFTESDVFNPSTLTISAGPGIRFAIIDDGVCIRYDLARSDFDAFFKGAMRAKRNFVDDGANNGLTPETSSWKNAIGTTNEAIRASLPKGSQPNCR